LRNIKTVISGDACAGRESDQMTGALQKKENFERLAPKAGWSGCCTKKSPVKMTGLCI
jgi:hypothetical protein